MSRPKGIVQMSDADREYILAHYKDRTESQLAYVLGRHRSTIMKLYRKLGITDYKGSRQPCV